MLKKYYVRFLVDVKLDEAEMLVKLTKQGWEYKKDGIDDIWTVTLFKYAEIECSDISAYVNAVNNLHGLVYVDWYEEITA
jgi:hypothetical protein